MKVSKEKPPTTVSEKNRCELLNIQLHTVDGPCDQKNPEGLKAGRDKKVSLMDRVRSRAGNIPSVTAEIVMFLYMFSYSMRSTSSTAMIIEKVCVVHLGYPEDVCNSLRENATIKLEVTKMANNYGLGQSMIQMLPSSVMALFMGSWSDKYGRKFPMMLALAGIIVDGLGSTASAYFLHTRVEYYYVSAIFTGFSGGFICVMAILYSYASDISTPANRTMKYAMMQVAFGISMPIGALVGGWIFKFYGFIPVFATSTCGHVLGLCCVVFCLKETRGLEITDGWLTKFRSFWSLEGVRSSFRATAKRRPNKGRKQLWFLILAMATFVLSYASLNGITFLYVHHRFDWDNTTFSTISAIYMGIGFVIMMIIVPVSKKLNVADPALGILGSASLIMRNVGIGLANRTWIYHLSSTAGLFGSLAMLASRSRISKVIPRDDLGKVFSFVSAAESLLPIAAASMVSQAFNATLGFFPGLVFVVMGSTMVIPLGVYIWIALLPAIKSEATNEEAKGQATEEPSTTKL